jgi:hypothetical protein
VIPSELKTSSFQISSAHLLTGDDSFEGRYCPQQTFQEITKHVERTNQDRMMVCKAKPVAIADLEFRFESLFDK